MIDLDRSELEAVVRAVARRLESSDRGPCGGAADGAERPPEGLPEGGALLLRDRLAPAAAVRVLVAAAAPAAAVVYDPRGRTAGPAAPVISEPPDDPEAWAARVSRAVFVAPSLATLGAMAEIDLSDPCVELAFALIGLGRQVELPAMTANPLLASCPPALAAEARRLLSAAACLGFRVGGEPGPARASRVAGGAAAPGRSPSGPRLVTAEVASAIEAGSTLELPAGAIVTPSGLDTLRSRNVTVRRTRS